MSATAPVLLNRLLAKARFRHLQVLVRLAELGSVRRTAQSIGMTQPGVTQLLADLETLLGVELFHRHARGVLPTAACRDLLPMALQCLSGLSASAEAVASRNNIGQGVVRIWAPTATINGLLVRALPAFNQRWPGVQLHVREAEMTEQFQAIARQEVDMGFCRASAVTPEGWTRTALMDDEFVVVCAPDHPLARRRRLKWPELARHVWLPSTIGSAARDKLSEICEQQGLELQTCQVITRVSSMTWAMLQRQPLLTLVPASVFRQLRDAGQLVMLHLDEAIPFEPMGMLLPARDVPPASRRVADFLLEFTQSGK